MLQHARRLPQQLALRLLGLEHLAAATAPTCAAGASFATKAAAPQSSTQPPAVSKPSKGVTVYKKTDWKALAAQLPKHTVQEVPTVTEYGQAFIGDLRSTSGLGLGDGLTSHTAKWLQADQKSPMEYIQEAEPIKVHGAVVASYGSDDPATGCPVEYINLRGTSKDRPAVCKYTGNKYYSDPEDWLSH